MYGHYTPALGWRVRLLQHRHPQDSQSTNMSITAQELRDLYMPDAHLGPLVEAIEKRLKRAAFSSRRHTVQPNLVSDGGNYLANLMYGPGGATVLPEVLSFVKRKFADMAINLSEDRKGIVMDWSTIDGRPVPDPPFYGIAFPAPRNHPTPSFGNASPSIPNASRPHTTAISDEDAEDRSRDLGGDRGFASAM